MIFMFPWEDKGTPKEKQLADDRPSEGEVKKIVRERDGYRCKDCGITQEMHQQKHDQVLEVHRLVPGVVYHPDFSVTLCVDCHNKKIRRTKDAFWCKDLRWVGFNLYDDKDAALYRALKARADSEGIDLSDVMQHLLYKEIEDYIAHDFADLTLTNDGL